MLQPEIALARRISARRGLTPPVPVQALVEEKADLRFVDIPVEIDGLCVDLKAPGLRPRVFVNKTRSHKRKRFTLAHEYGHLQIPWHIGTIIDVTDEREFGAEWFQYMRSENEANSFASELLLPRAWLSDLCMNASVAEVHRYAADKADVSVAATAIALLEVAPPGHLYAHVKDGVIVRTKQSPGTISKRLPYGVKYQDVKVQNSIESGTVADSFGIHVWWKVNEVTAPPKRATDLPWRKLQAAILDDCDLTPEQRKTLLMRINGTVSAQNGRLLASSDRTIERLFTACAIKLSESDLGPGSNEFSRHHLFLEFVRARAEDFICRDT